MGACLALGPVLGGARSARAVGQLFELQGSSCVLQDVSFNVQNTFDESELIRVLVQDACKPLRSKNRQGRNETTVGWGPDTYKRSASFRPGVSSLSEYGGHATITLKSESDPAAAAAELFVPGNGLQYLKIGTEQLRISKGVDRGGKVSYAYGWVDLQTPAGIPLELVVGTAADPLMLACLRCSNVAESVGFFENELGMSQQPFPYARQVGSNFEPQCPAGAVFLSYGPGQFGLLLVPTLEVGNKRDAKKLPVNFNAYMQTGPINVGTVLDSFKIVVDDKISSGGAGGGAQAALPPAAKRLLLASPGDEGLVVGPDGYRFRLQRYSEFEKEVSLRSSLQQQ